VDRRVLLILVNCDVKGLEVVVAAELSQDKILCQEVIDGVDIHESNRDRFGLGGQRYRQGETDDDARARKQGRLIAKIFKFRLIYGGTAYSYANDSDFMDVSSSEKFWQGIIDEYYAKYTGIAKWHKSLIETAQREGQLEIPSGRFYPITPDYSKKNPWPHTIIKNYPVQGFGADLVMLARLQAAKLLKAAGVKGSVLISTIHDSIVADCINAEVELVGRLLKQAVEDVPRLCKQTFHYDFKLPLTAEVQYGPNKRDMKDLTF
jgi:DNA polymerase I-like protein with 3'-5' exonuclease and polymerase domains